MSIKTWFLTSFREIFLYHYKSLEFRAKIFALVIAPSCDNANSCDLGMLQVVAGEIYIDKYRREVFLNITREYIDIILRNPKSVYDEAVKDINRKVKTNKELAQKINIEHIKRFLRSDISEEKQLLQQRIFEFLEAQSKNA